MTSSRQSLADVTDGIRQAETSGDYLSAFDRATRGIVDFPHNESLKYLAVRAVARAGSPQRAETLYREYGLAGSNDVEIASLEARIAKDRYLLNPRDRSLAVASASLYERIFERTGNYFPGINAATMWMLAGDIQTSQALASRILAICEATPQSPSDEAYWLHVTQAEGALLLGDMQSAEHHLRNAAVEAVDRHDAKASTAKQLRLICKAKSLDDALLGLLPRPAVVFYAGHMIAAPGEQGRFPAALELSVAARIEETLNRLNVGIGFGSLASGADILFAEALLARGAELHVVLSFNIEEFKKTSVAPAKGDWLSRFEECLANASSVVFATQGAYLGHDVLFSFAAKIGMGLARIRSRALEAKLRMVAVWDGKSANQNAGTAADVAYWRKTGLETEIIRIEATPENQGPPAKKEPTKVGATIRSILPVLFGDVKGFSDLQEQHLPAYNAHVLTRLAKTIHSFGEQVLFTNTWGDAVHVVFADIGTAAACALRMQDALNEIDFAALNLPIDLSMRISLHVGPVFVGHDPINDEETYFGRTLTRAARMEPVTPVGEVYVTERFAALIQMEYGDHVQCSYVGNVPLAKNFGSLRMYRLALVPD